MNLFQILVLFFIAIFFIVINRGRTVIIERMFYIIITLGGLFFIFFPDVASTIAAFLGIGRGADLIFYAFILFSWFWFASASVKMRYIDRKITLLVRLVAITHPLQTPQFNSEGEPIVTLVNTNRNDNSKN